MACYKTDENGWSTIRMRLFGRYKGELTKSTNCVWASGCDDDASPVSVLLSDTSWSILLLASLFAKRDGLGSWRHSKPRWSTKSLSGGGAYCTTKHCLESATKYTEAKACWRRSLWNALLPCGIGLSCNLGWHEPSLMPDRVVYLLFYVLLCYHVMVDWTDRVASTNLVCGLVVASLCMCAAVICLRTVVLPRHGWLNRPCWLNEPGVWLSCGFTVRVCGCNLCVCLCGCDGPSTAANWLVTRAPIPLTSDQADSPGCNLQCGQGGALTLSDRLA